MTGVFSLRWFLLAGALLIVAVITLVADLTGTGGTPTAYGHEGHGFRLECPTTEVAEGQSVNVYAVYRSHYEAAGTKFQLWFYTDAGTAGPSDYVEQNKKWTGQHDLFILDLVNGGSRTLEWTVETRNDDQPEFDETFTIRFAPDTNTVDPSDPDWDAKCEITIKDNDVMHPSGLWSDGVTTWVSDWSADKIIAYTSDGRGVPDQDFNTLAAAGNNDPHGIWSNGTTMYVADWLDPKLYAYDMATKARDQGKDISLHADNANPLDIWSDGSTMWIADAEDKKAYAYYLSGGERRQGKDINFHSGVEPFGIWSDGRVMWVTDGASGTMYAYTLDGRRQSSWDIDLDAANGSPRGIWSDGTTMQVLEHDSRDVYEYPLRSIPTIDLPSHHTQTSGIWSNGANVWVSNWGYDTIFAYNLQTRARIQRLDIGLQAGNGDAHGIWFDGSTMWVADWNGDKLFAYRYTSAGPEPAPDQDFNTLDAAGNNHPTGMWSDGATMYVADTEDRKIYAYSVATKAHDPGRDIDIGFAAFGIWSDDSIMWAADGDSGYLRAYTMDGSRQPGLDILLDAANNSPRGIWSDDATMYALQGNAAIIYAYRMPLGITLSLGPNITEEGGRQTVAARVSLTGERTISSNATVSLSFSHGTTDDGDFTSKSLPDVTIGAGANGGRTSLVFEPSDDVDNEGRETFTVTATMTHPGTGEPLTAQATLTLSDNDPVPTSIPDLAAGPVASDTTRLRVSWGSVPDAEQYRVEYKIGDGSYSMVARGDATARSETLTGLTADTTYTVRVTAIDTDDGSVDLVSGETTGKTLDSMGEVTVAVVADMHDRLDVSWPAVTGATGYRVEWKAEGGSYTNVARSDATATTERVTGLTANTGYTVRVTALHTIDGQSADGDSAEGSGTTGSDRTVSATDAAGALRVEQLFSSGIDLLWDAVATVDGSAVTGYTIEWADSADGPWVALDFPGEGRHCIANMTIAYLTSNGDVRTECYFSYSEAGDEITRGSAYYYRLVAHAGDVDSQPGPVLSRRVNNIGGL